MKLRKNKNNSPAVNPGAVDRIIGRYGSNGDGPVVICIAGIHGNEPAGIISLRSVFEELNRLKPLFRGEFVGVAGNIKALASGVRFIDEDLNRMWRPERVWEIISGSCSGTQTGSESLEQGELIRALAGICNKKSAPVYILDLHTTSSEGSPFITIADTLRNREFTDEFPIPRILGIEEQLNSTLLNFINELGFIAVGFEGGQHWSAASHENCTAAIWTMLARAGSVDTADIPSFGHYTDILKAASGGDRGVYEVRYRHDISRESGFSMLPGFKNFSPIRKGDTLARSFDREIRAPERGRIFMPLYQEQGEDGFFIIREIAPAWLKVSSLLRRAGVEKILPYLPGMSSSDSARENIWINLKIAHWNVIEFLHLLGYRKKSMVDGRLVVAKRKYDIRPPKDYRLTAWYTR